MDTFVLVHSPRAAAMTWRLAAAELRTRAAEAVVPELPAAAEMRPPYHTRYAYTVARQLLATPADRKVFLVSHSEAGPLLPVIRQAMNRTVAGYVFVDGGVPAPNGTLDRMSRAALDVLRTVAVDGMLPNWEEADLLDLIPDFGIRREFVAALKPLPIDLLREDPPLYASWPDAPCGYLKFRDTYRDSISYARARGWPIVAVRAATPFHMLVEPDVVAGSLIELARRMGTS